MNKYDKNKGKILIVDDDKFILLSLEVLLKQHFEKVINLYPFDYNSLLMLGWTKYKLQEFGKAKVLFNKVLMYSPEDASAQKGLDSIE